MKVHYVTYLWLLQKLFYVQYSCNSHLSNIPGLFVALRLLFPLCVQIYTENKNVSKSKDITNIYKNRNGFSPARWYVQKRTWSPQPQWWCRRGSFWRIWWTDVAPLLAWSARRTAVHSRSAEIVSTFMGVGCGNLRDSDIKHLQIEFLCIFHQY